MRRPLTPPRGAAHPVCRWFHAQGLAPPSRAPLPRNASLPQIKPQAAARGAPAAQPEAALRHDACAAEVLAHASSSKTLLVCDFDRTLTDWDAGERLCDELAPELTSLLSSLQMPACFVPVTNTGEAGGCGCAGPARARLQDVLQVWLTGFSASHASGALPALMDPTAPCRAYAFVLAPCVTLRCLHLTACSAGGDAQARGEP